MRKNISYLELEKIINQYYITAKDICIIADCNIKYARDIAKSIADEMEREGVPIVSTRPLRVPTERVLRTLHINPAKIRNEAQGIRKSGITA